MRDHQKNNTRFPLGTLLSYGPTAARATKFVAAVIPHEGAEPSVLRRWYAREGDIRNDQKVTQEIAEFFKTHVVRQTIVSDRITGCPHEEGIDYPLGAVCPE